VIYNTLVGYIAFGSGISIPFEIARLNRGPGNFSFYCIYIADTFSFVSQDFGLLDNILHLFRCKAR